MPLETTVIATRKPYMWGRNTTDLDITIDVTPLDMVGAITTSYNIAKGSPDPNVPIRLEVNMSPFAYDSYTQEVQPNTPLDVETPLAGAKIGIEFSGNLPSNENFIAFDGWEKYTSGTVGVSSMDVIKNITPFTPGYISANLGPVDNLFYRTSSGHQFEIDNSSPVTPDGYSVFPIVPDGLNIVPRAAIPDPIYDTSMFIQGRAVGNAVLWQLDFNIVGCPYGDEEYCIGFINRYGVWEFVDMVGAKKDSVKVKRSDFVRYDTGNEHTFNSNGYRSFEVNTGWVNEAFVETVEDLMLSEHIVLYPVGNIRPIVKLVIEDTRKTIQRQRFDKNINYKFKFKEAGAIISIV